MDRLRGRPRLPAVLGVCALALTAGGLAAAGLSAVAAFGRYGEELERQALMRTAAAAAATFPVETVAQLQGSDQDAGTLPLERVNAILRRLREALPQARFAYLMGLRGGMVVFMAGAEPVGSPAYAAPGSTYGEASPELRGVFVSGVPIVEGPARDRWGDWVSGLAPLSAGPGGPVIAILGIDIDAAMWRGTIARYRLFGALIVGGAASLVMLLGAFIFVQYRFAARLAEANRIVENSSTVVYRIQVAPTMPLTYVSDNIGRFGYTPRQVLAASDLWQQLLHPDDLKASIADNEAICRGEKDSSTWERRLRDADGTYRWWRGKIRGLRDGTGRVVALEGVLDEIDARKRAQDALEFTNLLLKTQMETSPDGIVVVDETGRIISVNRQFWEMWRIPPVAPGDDNGPVLAALAARMKDPQAFIARVLYLFEHPEQAAHDELETTDGQVIERHSAGLHTAGNSYLGRVWFFRDITARRRAEAQIRHSARHDGLTGLANRGVFREAVEHAMAQARRGGKGFAVLYLDLDHFKDVNDTLGHPVGDALLKTVAARLLANVREADVVARFGGDEFAVLATDVSEPADAAILAANLIAALAQPFILKGNDVRSGASVGIVVYEAGDLDAETLLSHADLALYQAKSEGRGDYRFFTGAMDADARTRVNLAGELRRAIADDELFLLYQPQVDLKSGRIAGMEAMVRWRHPTRGVLGPEVFLPVAESSGVILALGRWTMRQACRQAKAWREAGIDCGRIGIGISTMQSKRPAELEEDIGATLAETGVPPRTLELELTELVLMDMAAGHNDALVRLRETGLTLAIDDFGTGYSSLDYLRRLPVDRVKLSPRFIADIATDTRAATIVHAAMRLLQAIGMAILAEGVETRAQLALLEEWGCAEAQGALFAEPLRSEAITPLLQAASPPWASPPAGGGPERP
ncbi:putative bifunctional diguanylate cyclase/phosphodiesterase [Azorhizobium doebereinerae]|uniref:putative bifunctional diguanylate cyclase/phosphodiesterase n=1 Tax=Azorhizobium doebereinerae TaxID=281091 RepID=UPI0012EB1382|nr:bifunctional diguanylate cyclase/phosphodiesterase [Azorhizobium doebereinerae]